MKDLKNKELVIGLIALIVLSLLAIVLILKRGTPVEEQAEPATVEEIAIEEPAEEVEEVKAGIEKPDVIDEVVTDIAIGESADEQTENVKKEPELALQSGAKADDTAQLYHTNPELKAYTGEEVWQMEEIYNYWNDYKLDAVSDLIHLPRVRMITNELSGTNYFYYYGSTDSKGLPSGKGLSIYADNTYYFGNWQSGKRSGDGMYWKIYPDKTGVMNGVKGVVEHIYNGQWSDDYPNGNGQEHFEYDYDLMNVETAIVNAIGEFEDGYYDGEMYIMLTDNREETEDWYATADRGVFTRIKYISPSADGKYPVWKKDKLHEEIIVSDYVWMSESENRGYGIFGLKEAVQKTKE